MLTKYYTNPFDEDDDATCFADVDVVEVSMEDSREREYVPPPIQLTSRPSHVMSSMPRVDVQKDGNNPQDSEPSFCSAEGVSSGDSVNELSLSSFRSLPKKKNDGLGSPKADRWKIDELHQKLDELHRSMKEVNASKVVMEEDYEEYMESLKKSLASSIKEKNELFKAKSQLESDLRSVRAEKDNLAFLYSQEKDRNEVLSQQVSQLELELSLAHENHRKMMCDLHESHQEELARSARFTSSQGSEPLGGSSSGIVSRAEGGLLSSISTAHGSCHLDPWGDVDSRSSLHEKLDRVVATPPQLVKAAASSQPPANQVPFRNNIPSVREVRARGKGDPNTSSWSFGNSQEVSRRPELKTEKEKNEQQQERQKEISSLEAELLAHNKARADLSAKLTRLEKSRIRSTADRNQKSIVEEELEAEEKALGRIRLNLRSLQSLTR